MKDDAKPAVSDTVRADVVCDHACAACWEADCNHAWPHRVGVKSLNGLDMGDCTDDRNERVCCVPGNVKRVRCVPAHNSVICATRPPATGGHAP